MIQLRIHGGGIHSVSDTLTVADAKNRAARLLWLSDEKVKAFEAFVSVNDYTNRVVHEWDAEGHRWYEVEMWEGAQP